MKFPTINELQPRREMHELMLKEQSLAEELAASIVRSVGERREPLGTPEAGPQSFLGIPAKARRLRAIAQCESLLALFRSIDHADLEY